MANILVVDDSPVNRELISAVLRRAQHAVLEAADGAEALRRVRSDRPDLVICDILMPTMDGYEFVRRMRVDQDIANTPVIFCTATFLEREARRLAESCGVLRVLTKPVDIKSFSKFDALTGLPNRSLFLDRLSQAIAQAARGRYLAGVAFVDLDRFKVINDTWGHAAGDRLLTMASHRLS